MKKGKRGLTCLAVVFCVYVRRYWLDWRGYMYEWQWWQYWSSRVASRSIGKELVRQTCP